tara:strand:- start:872 stop:2023 length:1152 start_codon:yes stop_codon:yes gene_type:complete
MKYVFLLLLFTQVIVYPIKNVIGRYILNDVSTSVLIKSRTQHGETNNLKWNYYSNVLVDVSFPKISTYLDINPHLEFGHFTNHANPRAESITRLNEASVDLLLAIGTLSIGDKRLSTEGGRFLSDSGFNLLPRTFGQISFKSAGNMLNITYLNSMVAPDSTLRHYYQKGSYVISIRGIDLLLPIMLESHIYAIEDISNTYSFGTSLTLMNRHQLSSTIAYQTEPSITTQPTQTSSSLFHDAIYQYTFESQSFRLGTRFFQAGKNNTPGFSAPYSSGHSWDGYLNIYQAQIKSGFSQHFRSIFGSFSTLLTPTQAIKLDWYLFRTHSLDQNLGAEVNVSIQDELIKDGVYWMYKVGQFIPGDHSNTPSELKMWLDFSIQLGTSN